MTTDNEKPKFVIYDRITAEFLADRKNEYWGEFSIDTYDGNDDVFFEVEGHIGNEALLSLDEAMALAESFKDVLLKYGEEVDLVIYQITLEAARKMIGKKVISETQVAKLKEVHRVKESVRESEPSELESKLSELICGYIYDRKDSISTARKILNQLQKEYKIEKIS